jgi:hypothetical protein
MGRYSGEIKAMAKAAMKRMSSGFWETEYSARKKRLTMIENSGGDRNTAMKFFAEQTNSQINNQCNDDEKSYLHARKIFISHGVENALSLLIDKNKIENLDGTGRERYIFDLSEKLHRFKERFSKEQEYNLQEKAI